MTSIAPLLSVRKGAQAVEFYKAAFGARELFRVDAPDGAVVARMGVEEAEFSVADESPEHQNFSPETLSGGTVRMVMIVEDPDAANARAITAGARKFGQSTIATAGGWDGWSIPTGITGKSASP